MPLEIVLFDPFSQHAWRHRQTCRSPGLAFDFPGTTLLISEGWINSSCCHTSSLHCSVLLAIELGYYRGVMNIPFNLILGILAIVYGLYSYKQRKVAPEKIEKLQSMIERNGEKMGHSIHLFGYTILPIVAGLLLLFSYFQG